MCHTWTCPVSVESRQNPRQNHGRSLGSDDQALAIDAVGSDTSEGGDQKDRNLAGKPDRAEQQCGFRHAVDEPCLGHGLHPCTDERDELPAEEQLKIAVTQGAQSCGPLRQARLFRRRFFYGVEIFLFDHFFFGHELPF